ncbi:hypothetical protein ACJ2A9_07150 [Anaerobacillus sp. MEB173]|uniref:hypothetical protein n=1 Tax=Anaerobacillus sp. MEB173 TaxID=3383345 RepID=UPI003F8EDCB3
MDKKKQDDSQFEGRDKFFMDEDRMVNEGMAGGTVSMEFDSSQIEETIDFEKEARPQDNTKKN